MNENNGVYRFVGGPRDGQEERRPHPACALVEYLVMRNGEPRIERYDVRGTDLVFRDAIGRGEW